MGQRPLALVLTQHYEPEPNWITRDVAVELSRTHEVRVVTSHPQYPLGRFYPGTRWWRISRSEENGVTVYRVPMFPDHSASVLRRLISYLSFAVIGGLTALAVAWRPKLVWVYHGPFVSGVAAVLFKWLFGSRLVLTCADLWPESFAAAGITRGSAVVRLALSFRRWFNRRMDLIICATEGTLRTFREEGMRADQLRFVPVWVPFAKDDGAATSHAADIVYVGNIGPAQALETAVRGCIALSRERPAFRAVFAGSGADLPRLKALVEESGCTSISFPGRISPTEARAMCIQAKAQILSLANSPAFAFTLPSKLGFSLAAGTPIIFCAPGETADVLRAQQGVFEFRNSDPESFTIAATRALSLSEAERRETALALTAAFNSTFSAEACLLQYRSLIS